MTIIITINICFAFWKFVDCLSSLSISNFFFCTYFPKKICCFPSFPFVDDRILFVCHELCIYCWLLLCTMHANVDAPEGLDAVALPHMANTRQHHCHYYWFSYLKCDDGNDDRRSSRPALRIDKNVVTAAAAAHFLWKSSLVLWLFGSNQQNG